MAHASNELSPLLARNGFLVGWVSPNGRCSPDLPSVVNPPENAVLSMSLTKPRVICVAGARPNFMKIGPVLKALDAHGGFTSRLVHTGQHYDDSLSRVFFDDLGIPRPDVELEVGSASHSLQTAEILRRFEPVLQTEQPQVVMVVGDVNSTLACAVAAAKFHLERPFSTSFGRRTRPLVAHVEAGLRSFDDDMPEEVNRKLTDAITDLLFVSEPSGLVNLRREGAEERRLFLVGNVMIDSLLAVRDRARESAILETLGLSPGGYALLTLHRPSNVDDPSVLRERLDALESLAAQLPVVFPVHPRTRARLAAAGIALPAPPWHLTEPFGYVDFVRLLSSARIVLTDSGGIQEETTVLGVPCVTLRESTERPVTVEEGTNHLAGTSPLGIREACRRALNEAKTGRVPQFWDGRASARIVDVLARVFEA